ncbi:hypothetical protein [Deinococcus sedimenti]|uniref:Uncharacterized protein n=1 Tax=Deinococcus sedimenti TaxID=1867090 RepID=A0ABQ2SA18_9DEIO|nr:hypothetical protein [Deinococcus sedimenti]GGS02656.1 hypothetical protein GCM10008960_31580 [Deinococcus sedimenti]
MSVLQRQLLPVVWVVTNEPLMVTLTPAIPGHAVPVGEARDDDADEFVSEDISCSSPYVPARFTVANDRGYRAEEQVIQALARMPGADTIGGGWGGCEWRRSG